MDLVNPIERRDDDPLRARARGTLLRLSRTGELPTLPAAATTALGLVRDPDADIDRLCRVVQSDVGLVARVLRVANSPGTGRRMPTRRLQDAVMTLGLGRTCQILVAACARMMYAARVPGADALWNHALAVAVAAAEIARCTRRADPGSAFLPGLFHDVGRVVFLLAEPTACEVIDAVSAADGAERSDLERGWYGFDHAEASAILVEDWGLPPDHCDAIRWHHAPDEAGTARPLAMLLNAADALAYAIGRGHGLAAPASVSLAPLMLSPEDEVLLIEHVRRAWDEQRQLLG